MAKNEMKPGWEQTLMAEEIFRQAIAKRLADAGDIKDQHIEEYAECSIRAALIWQKLQKEYKLPHLISTGNVEDN